MSAGLAQLRCNVVLGGDCAELSVASWTCWSPWLELGVEPGDRFEGTVRGLLDREIRAGHQREEDYEVMPWIARGVGRCLRCGRFPAEDGRGADTPTQWEGG